MTHYRDVLWGVIGALLMAVAATPVASARNKGEIRLDRVELKSGRELKSKELSARRAELKQAGTFEGRVKTPSRRHRDLLPASRAVSGELRSGAGLKSGGALRGARPLKQ